MTNWIQSAKAVLVLTGFILVATSVVIVRGTSETDNGVSAHPPAPATQERASGTVIMLSDSMPISESLALSSVNALQHSVGELMQNIGHILDLPEGALLLAALCQLGGGIPVISPRLPIAMTELHKAKLAPA
ncbi:MAG: hypothetical protein JRM99_00640 [Nitrososphaerota archaeon]|nr:hypothetical protein [Nitrososphaerota archaeon]